MATNATVSRTVNIYINQDAANASLQKLTAESDRLQRSIDKGTAAGKDMSAQIENLGKKKQAIADLTAQIDGKMAPSLLLVRKHVQDLQKDLEKMSSSAPGYADKLKAFQDASKYFTQLKTEIGGVSKALTDSKGISLKDIMGGVFGGNIITQAANALKQGIGAVISGNTELSDSMSEVQQTTGMTNEELQELIGNLSKIDTRTPIQELLKIAQIGGQFNVPTEQMSAFVQAIDRANVVLGSEFGGGAEEITTQLALLRNVFKDIKSDNVSDDLSKIGNSLIVLAQQGAATAPVVSDFAKRMAPLESTARLSSGAILGLSATLQELAVNQERGGTAIVKLFDKMISNASEFAKVAGMSTDAFKKLVDQDSMAAFTKVLQGFKQGGNNITIMNKAINDLEVSGVGAKEVLVKLSDNTDMLAQKINTATGALKQTDAIEQQFAVRNDNLAGTMEKIGNKIKNAFVNPQVMDSINETVQDLGKLVGVVDETHEAFGAFVEQKKVVEDLEKSTVPLINRYVELKDKTHLSNDEQQNLKDIIQKIAQTIPTAITQFDAYGKAMDISAQKARDYIAVQKLALQERNAAALAEENKKKQDLIDQAQELQRSLNYRDKQGNIVKTELHTSTDPYAGTGGGIVTTKLTGAEIAKLQQQLQDTQQKLIGVLGYIEQLGGEPALNAMKKLNLAVKGTGDEAATTGKKAADANTEQATTLTTLKAKLQELQSTRENINIKDKAALAANMTQIKALQEQIAALEGTRTDADKKSDARARKAETRLAQVKLAIEQETNYVTARLQDMEKGGQVMDQQEIARVQNKFTRLIALAKGYTVQIAQLTQLEQQELSALIQQQFAARSEKEYTESLQALNDFFQKQRQAINQQYIDGTLSKDAYNTQLKQLDADESTARIKIIQYYAPSVKKAANDLEQGITDAQAKQIAARTNAIQNEQEDRVAQAEIAVLTAKKGSKAQLAAQKELLQAQFEQNTAGLSKNSAQYQLALQQLDDATKQKQKEHTQKLIQGIEQGVQEAGQLFSDYVNFLNAQDEAELSAAQAKSDQKKAILDQELADKKISQTEYNRLVKQEDDKLAKEKEAVEAREFKRKKQAAIIEATIQGALGIAQIWGQYAGMPVLAGILTAIEVAAVAVQIATIAAQQPPSSSYGIGGKLPIAGQGGMAQGNSHAQGGIDLIDPRTGRPLGSIEGGEPILSQATYANNRSVVDALLDSSMHRNGAKIGWLYSMPAPINSNGISSAIQYVQDNRGSTSIAASGFASGAGGNRSGNGVGQITPEFMQAMVDLSKQVKSGIKSYILYTELDKKNQEYNTLKNESRQA